MPDTFLDLVISQKFIPLSNETEDNKSLFSGEKAIPLTEAL